MNEQPRQPRTLASGIRDTIFGEGVTLVEPLNLYGCRIKDHVFVGPFVEIQRGVSMTSNPGSSAAATALSGFNDAITGNQAR